MKSVYLDNAASTPVAPEVIETMMPYFSHIYGNASSIHSFGKEAKVLLEDTRDLIAEFLGAKKPKEIFFTSGGTESNNFAIKGIAFDNPDSLKKHIITSSIEHLAVMESIYFLRDKLGFDITVIRPDRNGFIDKDKIAENIRKDTFFISLMHANNEIGSVNEIGEIKKMLNDIGREDIIFHSDTVQSVGKMNVNFYDMGVNLATLSSHKIYGPKGVGVLYVKDKTRIGKFIHGGSQERDMRGGTENIPAIAGLKRAVEMLKDNLEDDLKHYKELKDYAVTELRQHYGSRIIFNSPDDKCLCNILNVSFPASEFGMESETFLIKLDLKGICVSGTSACSSGSAKPSRVISEINGGNASEGAVMRISFGRYNTLEDVKYFVNTLKETIN